MATNPDWRVGDWELSADLHTIERQWASVREPLEDPELYELRDADVSGWSCGEHAGHIAMVTRWIASGIEQNLAEPTRDTDGAWADPTRAILEAGDFPRGVAQSPSAVDPTRGQSRESFVTVLEAAREGWERVRGRASELPECPARFPHFALGYLTSTEWVRFCAVHTAHHLAVVRDIRAASSGASGRTRDS